MTARSVHLDPTPFINSTHPDVVAFARDAVGGARAERDRAVRLYYAVRDGIRYDPWSIRLTREGFTAARCLAERRGFCIPKATLLAAVARASGIPARLGFADVRNHLATPRLLEIMKGCEVFLWHAYTDLWIDGRWVKATPAFNRELCDRFGVMPLEFDGLTDSLFQPFTDDRRPFMEYVQYRGAFDDLPFDQITSGFLGDEGHAAWIAASAESPASPPA